VELQTRETSREQFVQLLASTFCKLFLDDTVYPTRDQNRAAIANTRRNFVTISGLALAENTADRKAGVPVSR
jgi:hypothetical protein